MPQDANPWLKNILNQYVQTAAVAIFLSNAKLQQDLIAMELVLVTLIEIFYYYGLSMNVELDF